MRKAAIGVLFVVIWGYLVGAVAIGTWTGTTGQGRTFNFTVDASGQNITQLVYSLSSSCGTVTSTVTGNIPINNNSFTITSGFCPSVQVNGTFTGSTASGTLAATYTPIPFACNCSGTVNTSWSATGPGPVNFPPTVAITSPTTASTFATIANSIDLAGTAGDDTAVTQVTWSNNRGGSGTATGTTSWSIAGIPLQLGANVITVTASDGALSTSTVLTVTRNAAPTVALDRTAVQFGATSTGAAFTQQTPNQTVRISQSGSGTMTWTATPSDPWITVSPTSGTGPAALTVGVAFAGGLPVSGAVTGTIALTFTGAANTAGPISVRLSTIANGASVAPVGLMETPAEGATGITGSIAVTGWAIDDVGVTRVRVLRDPVAGEGASLIFIGNAVLVEGSRPDVAGLNPTLPLNTRAGWGYLLLTNFLPNQGNGTFKLSAFADDVDGHATLLGTRTITCTNSTATKPFGAIDTPGQGDVISGPLYNNFGWVLSRGPALAYPPFGTVSVVIDGQFGSAPTGWVSRSDLVTLFPSTTFPGVTNALGVSSFDTTTLANGVHTIAWVVTADNGEADGIGSRYFTVANGSGLQAGPAGPPDQSPAIDAPPLMAPSQLSSGRSLQDEVAAAPPDRSPIAWRRGYRRDAPFLRMTATAGDHRVTVEAEELDRVELRLSEAAGHRYTGYTRVGDALGPLPIGSHLDQATGLFVWQPGVGFVGAYDLVFVRWAGGRAAARQDVRVALNPKRSDRIGPQIVIDTPPVQAEVSQPFLLAGWAIDPDDAVGTGVDTLHVWAYPLDTCGPRQDSESSSAAPGASGGPTPRAIGKCADPIFVGPTAYGGNRPDVAAIFGDRFRASGYGLQVDGLAPGNYDLAVFAWSTARHEFAPAKVVRVTVR